MDGFWAIFWMALVLKIPILFALWIVWYAIKQEPTADEESDGGQQRPRRKPPRRPMPPRRPAGGAGCRPSPCPQLADTRRPKPARVPARR
jgi:hypothetical protein